MSLSKISAIAVTTHREAIRGKILYVLFFFAIVLVLVSTVFGKVTIGDQSMVIKDFGLMSISLFTILFCVINGARLLDNELSQKTIYNILSKPISRSVFLIGKFFGMLITATVLELMMALLLSLFLFFVQHQFEPLLFEAYAYIWLEIVLVCGIVIFFSSVVITPLLVGMFSIGLFLAGRSSEYILKLTDSEPTSTQRLVYAILPHFEKLNVSSDILYGEGKKLLYGGLSAAYVLCYLIILLLLSLFCFRKREFQ
jgi:Cu-processing system permease protein